MSAKYNTDGIVNFLQEQQDLYPEKYDGSYTLVQETVKSYSFMNDYSDIDYRDLNLIYHMAVVTWRHSIDKKKESVQASHLPDSEKARLLRILDEVWSKAVNREYEHSEAEGRQVTVGMFGTGFFSFEHKTSKENARTFIKLCIDISEMNDTDGILDRAESVFNRDFRGMGAASASIVLHCLKPNVFPIINGNMGRESIYEVLGIRLKNKHKIDTYIPNTRTIREYRDKTVDFKNYRVFDLASRELPQYSEGEEMAIDYALLDAELDAYVEDFERIKEEETYKWEAIACFKKHFDINSGDFAAMLDKALAKSNNLLSRNMYFAKKGILEIAQYDPEYTREMFRELFDESEPVINRMKQFEEDANIYYQIHKDNPKSKNHYQDPRTSSVYLFFNYPEKYYIYLSSKFENAAKQIGYSNVPKSGSLERIQAYYDFADLIYEHIKDDKRLTELNQSRLNEECYEDSNNHVMAEDIIYFLNCRYKADNAIDEEIIESDFFPSLDEYNPGLSAEQYEEVFLSVKRDQLDTLLYLYQMGGEGTCKQIANKYGYTYSRYISHAVTIAKKVEQETGCPVNFREDGSSGYWAVLFLGKNTDGSEGTFIWKLRKPVEDAIKSMVKKGLFENMESKADYSKNIILYGPPGTGKTYHTILYSVAIIEGKDIETISLEATTDYVAVKERYDLYMKNGQVAFTTFHQSYGYEEFIEGIKPYMDLADDDGDIRYVIEPGVFKSFCESARAGSEVQDDIGTIMSTNESDDKRYVFILDEINRGNISKVFGELITLIESSKRLGQEEALELTLPYSKKSFGIPNNVYILGTMNTADRSIALMDTALRRRFDFIEMLPETALLDDIEDIQGINVSAMLRMINRRIELLIDREHMIGHSYFMPLKETPTIDTLGLIFKNRILPLLQEYFFDDYEKIRLILGDNQKENADGQFITRQIIDSNELFGNAEGIDELARYIIHEDVFDNNPEAYIGIYK